MSFARFALASFLVAKDAGMWADSSLRKGVNWVTISFDPALARTELRLDLVPCGTRAQVEDAP